MAACGRPAAPSVGCARDCWGRASSTIGRRDRRPARLTRSRYDPQQRRQFARLPQRHSAGMLLRAAHDNRTIRTLCPCFTGSPSSRGKPASLERAPADRLWRAGQIERAGIFCLPHPPILISCTARRSVPSMGPRSITSPVSKRSSWKRRWPLLACAVSRRTKSCETAKSRTSSPS